MDRPLCRDEVCVMRLLVSRTFMLTWLAAIAAVSLFASACAFAEEGHETPVSAAGESHANDSPGGDAHAAASEDHATTEHGEAEHDGAGHGEEGHGGVDYNAVPLIFEPKLFVWSLGLFLAFLFVARKVAWGPMIQGLDAREARVNQALHDAEAARVEAAKLLADHDARMDQVQDEVKEIVAAARVEAEAEKARIIAEADTEATALRDKAIADIEAAHRQAADELDSQIGQQVAMATEHVLGHG